MANTNTIHQLYQRGAVSLFAVIFAALLLTVLTVGFISLMISGQQRAMNNDLSQSAYDSAMAGVEDAKRVLRACASGNTTACDALDTGGCNVIANAGIAGSIGASETVIRSSTGGGSDDGSRFDQAYTCVTIMRDTPDYLADLHANEAHVIPLRAAGSFNRVILEWYTAEDLDTGGAVQATPGNGLPQPTDWDAATPPVVRAQLITPGEEFGLSELDGSDASQTIVLRPGAVTNGSTNPNFSMNGQSRATDDREHNNSASLVTCSRNFANNGYSCRAQLTLNEVVSAAASSNTLLRLNAIYKGAQVRVTLASSTGNVNFRDVQPAVDSTGRANDLFRRVESRLGLGDGFAYPSYVVDAARSICKDFSVDPENVHPGSCNPNVN